VGPRFEEKFAPHLRILRRTMLPKVGTTIGAKYALEAVIGRGGMGAVYRAKNLLTGRRVALKWILPTLNGADEMRARLFREARAMGRIEHPNVCAVYDVGQDGDAVYLVMKPAECVFYLALLLLDPGDPEARLTRMYR
jgi:serine/threonine protein kinase